MQVDLKALKDEMRSNTYPFFSSDIFDSELEDGWISNYQYNTRTFGIFIFVNVVINGIAGNAYTEKYIEYTTTSSARGYPMETPTTSAILYAYSCICLAVLGLFPAIGMYLMSIAISDRNLAKQDSALKVFTITSYIQLGALIINYLLSTSNITIGMFFVRVFTGLSLAVTLVLKVIAFRMRDVMVDKGKDMKAGCCKILYQYPRFFSDIERGSLIEEDATL